MFITKLVLAGVASLAIATPTLPPSPNFPTYFFVFGDSYSSTGFSISGAKPSSANPLGNPPLPGNTLSGGLTWPGVLSTELNKSTILTYNFAVSGATVDNSIVAPIYPNTPSVADQIDTWSQNLVPPPAYAPWTSDNAVFGVWIGTNDVGNTYSSATFDATLSQDQNRLFDLLGKLHASGARKFVLLTVAPTHKTPFMSTMPDADKLAAAISKWNFQLRVRAIVFALARFGTVVKVVDTTPAFEKPLATPQAYGAIDATCVTCVGPPDAVCGPSDGKCLWYNSYHPGPAIQKQVAAQVAATVGPWVLPVR